MDLGPSFIQILNYYHSIFDRIKGNSKTMWNQINDIIGKSKNNKLPTTMYNHNTVCGGQWCQIHYTM